MDTYNMSKNQNTNSELAKLVAAINTAMEDEGLSDYDVEKKTGIAASTIYRIRKGITQRPEMATIRQILYAVGLPFDYGQKAPPLALIHQNVAIPASDIRRLPIIDLVQAGNWRQVADPYERGTGVDYLPVSIEKLGGNAFVLVVDGESMLPNFAPGDQIIVDPGVEPTPGRYVVAKLANDEAATFKKYRPRGHDKDGREIIELAPLNPDWPTLYINADNPGHIVGTVVWHYRQT